MPQISYPTSSYQYLEELLEQTDPALDRDEIEIRAKFIKAIRRAMEEGKDINDEDFASHFVDNFCKETPDTDDTFIHEYVYPEIVADMGITNLLIELHGS